MMSENFKDFIRVFSEYGLYRKAVCYMAFKTMDASTDICGYGCYHSRMVENDANYVNELAEALETRDNEDYIYTSKYARGINPSVEMAVGSEIEEVISSKSPSDRERYIYDILRELHNGYCIVEEVYTNRKYKDLFYCIGNCLENKNDENESENKLIVFANLAYSAYIQFIHKLFAVCLQYGINLEYLQDKYELRIMHDWYERWIVEEVGGVTAYKVLCAALEHPLRKDKRLSKSRLSNIWEQVKDKYIQGSEKTFLQMYSDTTFESVPKMRLKWVAKPPRNKGVAKGALVEFLRLLGKNDEEIQKTFEIYFGIVWKSSYKQRDKNSQHYNKLKEIILSEE